MLGTHLAEITGTLRTCAKKQRRKTFDTVLSMGAGQQLFDTYKVLVTEIPLSAFYVRLTANQETVQTFGRPVLHQTITRTVSTCTRTFIQFYLRSCRVKEKQEATNSIEHYIRHGSTFTKAKNWRRNALPFFLPVQMFPSVSLKVQDSNAYSMHQSNYSNSNSENAGNTFMGTV